MAIARSLGSVAGAIQGALIIVMDVCIVVLIDGNLLFLIFQIVGRTVGGGFAHGGSRDKPVIVNGRLDGFSQRCAGKSQRDGWMDSVRFTVCVG